MASTLRLPEQLLQEFGKWRYEKDLVKVDHTDCHSACISQYPLFWLFGAYSRSNY